MKPTIYISFTSCPVKIDVINVSGVQIFTSVHQHSVCSLFSTYSSRCFSVSADTVLIVSRATIYTQTWKKNIFYTSKVWSKNLLKFQQKGICNKTAYNVFHRSVSKTRLPHIYRSKNWIINLICYYFLSENLNLLNKKTHKNYPQEV